MSAIGYIQVHAYTSKGRIPLQDVAVTITDTTGKATAMRLTNRSGILDAPVEVAVPENRPQPDKIHRLRSRHNRKPPNLFLFFWTKGVCLARGRGV